MFGRTLSFASLLFLAATPAMADTVPGQVIAEASAPAPSQPLVAKWKTSVRDGVLVAVLTLVNAGSAPVDVMSRLGSRPGPNVQASVGGASLVQVLDKASRSDMMSRMGPMPSYVVLAAGQELVIGTYRFMLPAGAKASAVELVTAVRTVEGAEVLLTTRADEAPGV